MTTTRAPRRLDQNFEVGLSNVAPVSETPPQRHAISWIEPAPDVDSLADRHQLRKGRGGGHTVVDVEPRRTHLCHGFFDQVRGTEDAARKLTGF